MQDERPLHAEGTRVRNRDPGTKKPAGGLGRGDRLRAKGLAGDGVAPVRRAVAGNGGKIEGCSANWPLGRCRAAIVMSTAGPSQVPATPAFWFHVCRPPPADDCALPSSRLGAPCALPAGLGSAAAVSWAGARVVPYLASTPHLMPPSRTAAVLAAARRCRLARRYLAGVVPARPSGA